MRHYWQSGVLVYHVLAVLPVDYCILAAMTASGDHTAGWRWFCALRLMKLLRAVGTDVGCTPKHSEHYSSTLIMPWSLRAVPAPQSGKSVAGSGRKIRPVGVTVSSDPVEGSELTESSVWYATCGRAVSGLAQKAALRWHRVRWELMLSLHETRQLWTLLRWLMICIHWLACLW